jgi:hypothetical protein
MPSFARDSAGFSLGAIPSFARDSAGFSLWGCFVLLRIR